MKEQPKAAKSRQATKAQCPEKEWNFMSLDRWELVAATYYEYARESKTLRNSLGYLAWAKTDYPHRNDIVAASKDWPHIALFNASLNLKIEMAKLPVDVAALANTSSGLSEPWQKRKDKDHLRKLCGEFAAKSLAGAFRKIPESELLEMAGESVWDWAELDAVFDPTTGAVVEGRGVERMLVEINWKDFTDSELRNAFALWLKSKPRGIPEPSKRGKKPVDWIAKLDRLGLLRLRHHYTFDEAEPFLRILQLERGKRLKLRTQGECNREAERAVDHFHTLFPFLDPAEMPRSWPLK